ncbi:MAG: Sip1-related alpha-galactosidase [Eubacteriales bacterium]
MDFTMKVQFADGTVTSSLCKTTEKNGILAVYADYTGEERWIDAEYGAQILLPLSKSEVASYMADRRHSEFWCCPAFGEDLTEAPTEIQHFIYRKTDGRWGVIVPVVSEDYKCVLEGTPDGLAAKLFSWYGELSSCTGLAFVMAEGEDPFALTEACVKYALSLLNNGCVPRDKRRYPEVFEFLGWCSWDALQIRVSEEGLVEKCEEFKEKEIPVKWAILDDMWAEIAQFNGAAYKTRGEMFQLMHTASMYDYEASYTRFPDGLAHAVDRIHSYGLRVGIWHPTTGYWCGLDPNGKAYQKLKPYTFLTADGKIIGDWHEQNAFGYYDTLHTFFKACGADFLKVDNQSMTRRFYKGCDSVGKVTHAWHRGLEASVGLNFDNTMINCMGMASEDMWNRAYSSISRCSDDFQPEDRAWFTKHILQCTYNSILQGQFYWNDYDMWWTDDTQATKNSLLRAVSGGPIYVSDEIGRSRPEILKPLVFDDGRILRCDRSGMPTMDCLTSNPETSGKPLKIQNITKNAGVVAAFNITKEQNRVNGTVAPSDIPGLASDRFAVYEYFTGEYTIVGAEESIVFSLENADDLRLFLFVPYVNNFAALGRIDKFIAPAAIVQQIGENVTLYEDGTYAYIKNGKLIVEEK